MQNNKYADVVIDITNENVDRPFTYAVPESLRDSARPGMPVLVPFGNGGRTKTGYIIALKEETELDPARVKEILGPAGGAVTAETTLI
jgi:primosomal protein N' (replication factor Y)